MNFYFFKYELLTSLGWILALLSIIKIVLLLRTNLWFSILKIDYLKKEKHLVLLPFFQLKKLVGQL